MWTFLMSQNQMTLPEEILSEPTISKNNWKIPPIVIPSKDTEYCLRFLGEHAEYYRLLWLIIKKIKTHQISTKALNSALTR